MQGNRRRTVPKARAQRQLTLVERATDEDLDLGSLDPNEGMRAGFRYPKSFQIPPICQYKIRFYVNADITSLTFTAAHLLQLVCFSTAINTAYQVAKSVRLRYIEIWEPIVAAGTPANNTSGFIYYGTAGTNTGTNRAYFCTNASYDKPGHTLAPVPKNTVLPFWQNAASGLTFGDFRNLTLGATVDVRFDLIGNGDFSSVAAASFAVVAASAGLQGVHPPSASLTAVGWNNM